MMILLARVGLVVGGLALLATRENCVSAQTAENIQDITWGLGPSYATAIKGGAAGFINNTFVYAGGEAVPDNSTHDTNLTYGIPLGVPSGRACRTCRKVFPGSMAGLLGTHSMSPAADPTSSRWAIRTACRRPTEYGVGVNWPRCIRRVDFLRWGIRMGSC